MGSSRRDQRRAEYATLGLAIGLSWAEARVVADLIVRDRVWWRRLLKKVK